MNVVALRPSDPPAMVASGAPDRGASAEGSEFAGVFDAAQREAAPDTTDKESSDPVTPPAMPPATTPLIVVGPVEPTGTAHHVSTVPTGTAHHALLQISTRPAAPGCSTTGNQVVEPVDPTGNKVVEPVETTGNKVVEPVESTGTARHVPTGNEVVELVETIGNDVVEPVETTGNKLVELVETTGNKVVELVETTGAAPRVSTVAAGNKVVEPVETTGDAQPAVPAEPALPVDEAAPPEAVGEPDPTETAAVERAPTGEGVGRPDAPAPVDRPAPVDVEPAPAAPPAAAAAPPVDDIDVLARAELNRLAGGNTRLDVEIDTDSLGRLRVEAIDQRGNVSIQIHTERPDARALLTQQLDGLHAELSDARRERRDEPPMVPARSATAPHVAVPAGATRPPTTATRDRGLDLYA